MLILYKEHKKWIKKLILLLVIFKNYKMFLNRILDKPFNKKRQTLTIKMQHKLESYKKLILTYKILLVNPINR